MIDWAGLLADEPLPAAVIDLDAVDRNTRTLLQHLGASGKTARLATKSLRVPALFRHLAGLDPRVRGLMAYSAREAGWLVEQGFHDVLVAYPVARTADATLVGHAEIVQVIDDEAQLAALAGTGARVCIDVDVSLRTLGQHLGVRRSPVRDAARALVVARKAREAGLHVVAVMAYEAQVAGLSDGGAWFERPVKRWLKARSVPLAAARRKEVVDALRADGFAIALVNGGGSGSVATTAADPVCTEVTIGSGCLCPHLFDGYLGLPLEPAAFFALSVVRSSDAGFVTAFGGGIVASGSTGTDRSPVVHWPTNLAPLPLEGFGEVQTPFRVTAGDAPRIGSPVVCRPAKSGEWLERFNEVLLVRNGAVVERAPTYRGLGVSFG